MEDPGAVGAGAVGAGASADAPVGGGPAGGVRVESPVPEVDRVHAGRLDEGAGYATYRSRGTADWLLIHTLAGSGRLASASGAFETSPGDAVLLRPGVPHDYRTAPGAERWDIAYAHFRPPPQWLPLLEWPQPLGAAAGIGRLRAEGTTHRRIADALARAARAGVGALPRAELFAVNALEEALLWCGTRNAPEGRLDERVLRVVEFVDAHLAEPLGAERLAGVVHVSVSRLGRLFAAHVGMGPQQYVEGQRMLRARRLLELTRRPVGAVAAAVGYADPLYFSRRFRAATGVSPRAYRRRAERAAADGQ